MILRCVVANNNGETITYGNYHTSMTTFLIRQSNIREEAVHKIFTVPIYAIDVDNKNSTVYMQCFWPAPKKRMTRYPVSVTNLSAPLAEQQQVATDRWFVDKYPPEAFTYGSFQGRDNVSTAFISSY